MQIRQLALLFGLSMSGLTAACSSNSSPAISTLPQGGNINAAGATSAGAAGAGTAGAGTAGAGTAGAGGISSSGAGAGGAGTTAGAAGMGSGTAGAAGGGSTMMSAGCSKPLPAAVKTGQWSMMADPNDTAGNPPPLLVPCKVDPLKLAWPACVNGMVKRGYYVYVKAGYDPTKPSKVIYEGAGCDAPPADAGGTSGYPYQDLDGNSATQIIQVGLTYSRSPNIGEHGNCYDNKNPQSSDFAYFPILQQKIEEQFCVDHSKTVYSGYSTGAWVGNQFTCAFPERFHTMVYATGEEPLMQPTCAPGSPIASMFLHDDKDTYNTPERMAFGCARMLKMNGCSTTTCDWKNAAFTDPYAVPGSVLNPPSSLKCVQFKGCPTDKPVVWCSTNIPGTMQAGDFLRHYITVSSWIAPLFWDFINKY